MNQKVHFVLLLWGLSMGFNSVLAQTSYYHDGQGSVHALSSWWSSPNFSGTHPSQFGGGDSFVVQHGFALSSYQPWSFSGNGTVLLLERGSRLTLGESLSLGSGATLCVADSSLLEADTFSVSGLGSLHLAGGALELAKVGVTLPELSGSYRIDSGRISIKSAGPAVIRGTRSYDTLDIAGSTGIKTFSSAISGSHTLHVLRLYGEDTLNMENRSIGDASTWLIQRSGLLILEGTGTKPDIAGGFEISGGGIEYRGHAQSLQTIRNGIPFKYLKISGTSVGTSSGNINLADSAIFEVAEGAIWTMTNSNIGISPGQGCVVKINGAFVLHHEAGLLGGSQTAIRQSPDSLLFGPQSKVIYQRNGAQQISQATYRSLQLAGEGVKSGLNLQVLDSLLVSERATFEGSLDSVAVLVYRDLDDTLYIAAAEWPDTSYAQVLLHLEPYQRLRVESNRFSPSVLKLESGILHVSNAELTLDGIETNQGSIEPGPTANLRLSGNQSIHQLGLSYAEHTWSSIEVDKTPACTISLKDTLKIVQAISLFGGSLLSDSKLKLECTDSSCAQLLKSGGEVTGTLQTEMRIPSGGWAYLGAPIDAKLSQWNEQITMHYSGAQQNVFRWDAHTGSWSALVDSMQSFGLGNAYAIRFSPSDSGKVVRFFGELNPKVSYSNGRLAYGFPIDSSSFTDSTVVDGWNLLANPFAASLDWNAVRNRMGGQLNQFYYVYRDAGSSYLAHNGQLGNAGLRGLIHPFQAFFVKLGAASDTNTTAFDFDSSMLSLAPSQVLYKSQPSQVSVYLLNQEDTLGHIVCWLNSDAKERADRIQDAFLPPGSQPLFWKLDGVELAVLGRSSLADPVYFQTRKTNVVGGRLLVDHSWGVDTLLLISGEDSLLVFPGQRLIREELSSLFTLQKYNSPYSETLTSASGVQSTCHVCQGHPAEIYSMSGQMLKQYTAFQDLTELPKAAFYILRCKRPEGLYSQLIYYP